MHNGPTNLISSPTEPEDEAGLSAAIPSPTALTREEFAAHYQSCARVLWCIATAVLTQRTHVEDVLQEAVMIALNKLDQFDPNTNFTAWMGQIVRFVALNQVRKTKRTAGVGIDTETVVAHTEDHSESRGAPTVTSRGEVGGDQSSFDDHVLEALNSLEPTARACLLLRVITEMSYRDISLALSIPEGTAMSHVHRARRAMRSQLSTESPATNDQVTLT